MNTPTIVLQREAIAPLTHIFLSLDLLDMSEMNEETRSYIAIIRQNTKRLEKLIKNSFKEKT